MINNANLKLNNWQLVWDNKNIHPYLLIML